MYYETKEEIMHRIKDYDLKNIIETFTYVNKCKCNLVELANTNKSIFPNFKELISYFMRIEDCMCDRIFEENKL